jgi:hypothetical protein
MTQDRGARSSTSQAAARWIGHTAAVWTVISWPLWWSLLNRASNIGDWVGGGSAPPWAWILCLSPSAVGGLIGGVAVILAAAPDPPDRWALLEGLLALLSSGALFLLTIWCLLMLGIT